jgi:hypothetical protein
MGICSQRDKRNVAFGERRRTSFASAVASTFFAIAVACSIKVVRADDTAAKPTAEPLAQPSRAHLDFFEANIRPILVKHCYECHSSKDPDGGLSLDSQAGLSRGGDSGPAFISGNPEESRLIEAIRYKNPNLQMPPQNKLAPAEIAALEKWITLGAPDPRTEAPVSGAPAPTGMSIAEGREFWAFKPLADVAPPQIGETKSRETKHVNAAWIRTPIDAFIAAKLQQAGLSPAPPADKRTLIRRATFDLTGLPPTPAEIEEFLHDESPNAFSRVVERLLASPEYGVRWGRHWLDVARYADSNGLDENLAYGNAWRYRDYVVQAFNDDKPFDRFLIEQIAGDQLPDATRETLTATAFLALGAKVLAEPDKEKLKLDTIDEQLDTIGKAFLGMTIGCARCHDHKFDPVKQTDYYALAAIFKSTLTVDVTKGGGVKQWHEFSFADDIEHGRMKAINAAINEKKQAASAYKSAATAKLRDAARKQAVDYLAAAALFDAGMPLVEVAPIAEPLGLHPYVLHHCRQDLEFRRDEPLWAEWHRFAKAGNVEAIKQQYQKLFADAEAAWAAAKKADPKATKLKDAKLQAARTALYDDSGFVSVPTKPAQLFDAATLAEYNRLAEIARIAESQAPDLPSAMGAIDTKQIELEMPLHIRGSHHNLGKPVPRGFPEVMFASSARPTLPTDKSGRLQLAEWLADEKHPLTARVFVNRVWRWHFGRGLVASTDNFGRLGDRPTHPELLDYLARSFMQSGWSTKDLHRTIMASSVYQTASSHPDDTKASLVDPENMLLRKFRLQRLEAEAIRDALLAVTGRLEHTQGGKSIPLRNKQYVFDHTSIDHTKYDSLRRAIYLPIVRNNLYPLFEQFDFPDPTMPTGSRNTTTVAPQALLMLNSSLVMESADVWAEKLLRSSGSDSDRIRNAYEAAFGRLPTEPETKRALTFVAASIASEGDTPEAKRRAWGLLCQSLLATNEFIYVK